MARRRIKKNSPRSNQRVELRSFEVADDIARKMDNRKRNQLLGCMHAHNELTFLNCLLQFVQNPVSEGVVHDQAQVSQMWCVLQLLAGKLYETWKMLAEQFSLSGKAANYDPAVLALGAKHRAALNWLLEYFAENRVGNRSIAVVRNKTAFHYEGLDMALAVKNLATEEKVFHVAPHQ